MKIINKNKKKEQNPKSQLLYTHLWKIENVPRKMKKNRRYQWRKEYSKPRPKKFKIWVKNWKNDHKNNEKYRKWTWTGLKKSENCSKKSEKIQNQRLWRKNWNPRSKKFGIWSKNWKKKEKENKKRRYRTSKQRKPVAKYLYQSKTIVGELKFNLGGRKLWKFEEKIRKKV